MSDIIQHPTAYRWLIAEARGAFEMARLIRRRSINYPMSRVTEKMYKECLARGKDHAKQAGILSMKRRLKNTNIANQINMPEVECAMCDFFKPTAEFYGTCKHPSILERMPLWFRRASTERLPAHRRHACPTFECKP